MSTMKAGRHMMPAQTPQHTPVSADPRHWDAYLPPRRNRRGQALGWVAALAAAIALPFLFPGTLGISVLTQICVAVTFALAYNMLLGGTGLLSFGHALYFGTGAYATAHFLNYFGDAAPVVLVPLVGGLAAVAVGAFVALFTVRSGSIIFAMISLAVGQLAYSAATIMTSWSGGDEGIRLDPAHAAGWGIDFSSPLAIYFLSAGWAWLAALAMRTLTRTPLGRLMNATRDNAERMEFVGFSPVLIRGIALSLSAGFAGIAGALYALGFQVVTLDTLSIAQSSAGMLHTYIGGYTTFVGPVAGAILITAMSAHLSALTEAWPLYLGLFFITVIVSMRRGLAGSFVDLWRDGVVLSRERGVMYVIRQSTPDVLGALCTCVGVVLIVEMIHLRMEGISEPIRIAFGTLDTGLALNAHNALHWIGPLLLLAAGALTIARQVRKRHR